MNDLTRLSVAVYRKIQEWDEATSNIDYRDPRAEAKVKMADLRILLLIVASAGWFVIVGILVCMLWVLYGPVVGLFSVLVWLSPFLVYWRGYAVYWRAIADGEEDQ